VTELNKQLWLWWKRVMDPSDDDDLAPEKQLKIAKKMFIGGFFFLPWLWLCNYLYFREYLSKPNAPAGVKKFAYWSLAGFALETCIFVSWLAIYLTQRDAWGAGGDSITVFIPQGP